MYTITKRVLRDLLLTAALIAIFAFSMQQKLNLAPAYDPYAGIPEICFNGDGKACRMVE